MIDPVEAEELELITIRYNSQMYFGSSGLRPWAKVLEAFTDVINLFEVFGLVESELWCHEFQPIGRLCTNQCFNNLNVMWLVTGNYNWVRYIQHTDRWATLWRFPQCRNGNPINPYVMIIKGFHKVYISYTKYFKRNSRM